MNNSEKLILEARTEGQEYLRSQLQIALASDQRAVALGGIFVAAAAVVLGLDLAQLSNGNSAAVSLLVFGLIVASGFAFFAARPVEFDPPGNTPSEWECDITNNTPYLEALLEDMKHIDECILANNELMKENGRRLRQSMHIALGTLVFSGLVSLFLQLGAAQ